MFHVWFIPALIVFLLVVIGFYLVLKYRGGDGIRTTGRTVVDKPAEDQDPPPP